MSQTTKTILIILGSLLVLCACTTTLLLATGLWSFGSFISRTEVSVNDDPGVAVRVGAEIADFEAPPGFTAQYGIHIGDLSIVGYESQGGKSHILFAQFPDGTKINVEEMLKQISEYSGDSRDDWYRSETTIIEEKPVTIRGQASTLSIAEGTSSDGSTYRTATASFQGRNGPALMIVASPVEDWDMQIVEDLIASIQ
ncbi:MAG: hypothetical protein M3Y68_09245 [Chloroflexota bacterium]|nr:hypothetical protein [Chloroflexota bacterium]